MRLKFPRHHLHSSSSLLSPPVFLSSKWTRTKPSLTRTFTHSYLLWCSELSSGLYYRVKWLSTDVSEVRTASIIRDDTHPWWVSSATVLQPLDWLWQRLALSKGPNKVGAPIILPEDENRPSFRNIVFFRNIRRWTKSKKHYSSKLKFIFCFMETAHETLHSKLRYSKRSWTYLQALFEFLFVCWRF
jgi:hypothetical protein